MGKYILVILLLANWMFLINGYTAACLFNRLPFRNESDNESNEDCKDKFKNNLLKVELQLKKTQFSVGEKIYFSIQIINQTEGELTLSFNSGQVFDVIVKNMKEKVVLFWSEDKAFVQGVQEITLMAESSIKYEGVLETGKLGPGLYKLQGIIVSDYLLQSEPVEIGIGKL